MSLPPLPSKAEIVKLSLLSLDNHANVAVERISEAMRAYGEACAAAERERCIRVIYDTTSNMHDEADFALKEELAAAIRQASQGKP